MNSERLQVIRSRGFSADINVNLVENATDRFARSVRTHTQDRERLTCSEWADKYRVMPEASRYSRWSTARTPYMKLIMDLLSSTEPEHLVIVVRKAAQMGGSEGALNEVLRRIHLDPCTMLYFMENQDKAQAWMKERLDPALKRDPFSARQFGNAGLIRSYAGGQLICNGIGSSAALSSVTAKFVVGDEVARYPLIIGGEGDFLSLARQRITTYGDLGKIFLVSTALDTLDEEGTFVSYYNSGDQREFRCPCPHCGTRFTWSIEQLRIVKGRAMMLCESCGGLTRDGDERTDMTLHGEWSATAKRRVNDITSLALSGFIAPYQWRPWMKIWEGNRDATEGRTAMNTFYNLVLGLPFDEPEARTPDEAAIPKVMKVPKYRQRIVPDNVCVLTLAVDVQKAYLDCEVKGWAPRLENYSIDRIKIELPIDDDTGCVRELRKIFRKRYKKPNGQAMQVCLGVIDEGGSWSAAVVHKVSDRFPSPVTWRRGYGFVPHGALTCFRGGAISKPEKIILGVPGGKTVKGKRRVQKFWRIGTQIIKFELYGALNRMLIAAADDGQDPESDAVYARPHAPVDYDEDHFKELTAEKIKRKRNEKTGRTELYFYLPPRAANEALDQHVMNRTAAEILNLPDFTEQQWSHMKAREESRAVRDSAQPEGTRQERRQAQLARRRKLRAKRRGQ